MGTKWWIGLSVLMSTALQVVTISRFSVWHDEGYTLMLVSYPLAGIIRRTAFDVHPPLYYLLLKGWGALFGHDIVTLRLFSVTTMVLAILVTLLFVWRQFGEQAVRWAILPLVFGPFLIRYGQELRMYSLATLLVVGASWVLMEMLRRDDPPLRLSVGYGLLIATIGYTQYFALLIVPVHLVVMLLARPSATRRRVIVAAWIGAALLFAPWLPAFLRQVHAVRGGFWIPNVSITSFFSTLSSFLIFRPEWRVWHLDRWYAFILLLAAPVTYRLGQAFWKTHTNHRPARTLVVAGFVLPPVLLFGLSLVATSFYYDRYFVPFAPFFYVMLGMGLGGLWGEPRRRGLAKALGGFLILCFAIGQYNVQVVGSNFGRTNDEYFHMKELSARLIPQLQSGDVVVAENLGTYFEIRAYLVQAGKAEPLLLAPTPIGQYGSSGVVYNRTDLLVPALGEVTGERLWFVSGSATDVHAAAVGSPWQPTTTVLAQGSAKITLMSRPIFRIH